MPTYVLLLSWQLSNSIASTVWVVEAILKQLEFYSLINFLLFSPQLLLKVNQELKIGSIIVFRSRNIIDVTIGHGWSVDVLVGA